MGAVFVFRDVTERRQMEELLRQSQKMEAIGRLAGGIAHDFNNILTIITGYSQLLLQGGLEEVVARDYLLQILTAANRAGSLTQQILAFGRKQILAPTKLDLNVILRDSKEMVKRLVGERINITYELSPRIGRVTVDPNQMVQVLLNLAANARDAMPTGGQLAVKTAGVTLDASTAIGLGDLPAGPYVVWSVQDSGCGVPSDDLAHLFEPFFTTKEVGKGTGLGLAAVYGIIRQSHGAVSASSQVGSGTTISIYLPAEAEPAPPALTKSIPRPNGWTILLVEDDEAIRRMIQVFLEQKGYTVLEACDGLSALEAAQAHRGAIDLLMSDVVMPGMSGPQLALELRRHQPDLKLLFMSGFARDPKDFEQIDPASLYFLKKPFRISAAAETIGRILGEVICN
jgi:nitrogen-specific signal transduction histidine kinase/CheY-like chemotaxis protein